MRKWKRAVNDIKWEMQKDLLAKEEETGSILLLAAENNKSLRQLKKDIDIEEDFVILFNKLRNVSKLTIRGPSKRKEL